MDSTQYCIKLSIYYMTVLYDKAYTNNITSTNTIPARVKYIPFLKIVVPGINM